MPARRASARVARLVRSAAAAVRAAPLPLARPRVVARRSFAEC